MIEEVILGVVAEADEKSEPVAELVVEETAAKVVEVGTVLDASVEVVLPTVEEPVKVSDATVVAVEVEVETVLADCVVVKSGLISTILSNRVRIRTLKTSRPELI